MPKSPKLFDIYFLLSYYQLVNYLLNTKMQKLVGKVVLNRW